MKEISCAEEVIQTAEGGRVSGNMFRSREERKMGNNGSGKNGMVSVGTLEGKGLFVKTRSKGCNKEEILREDSHHGSMGKGRTTRSLQGCSGQE